MRRGTPNPQHKLGEAQRCELVFLEEVASQGIGVEAGLETDQYRSRWISHLEGQNAVQY